MQDFCLKSRATLKTAGLKRNGEKRSHSVRFRQNQKVYDLGTELKAILIKYNPRWGKKTVIQRIDQNRVSSRGFH